MNRAKCKQLCIRRSQHGSFSDDCGFDKVNCLKVLGFIFTDTFTWTEQISHLVKLASQRLHIIRSLKAYVTKPELIRVYHAIISSLFMYASPVYGQLPITLLVKLEKFQNRSHRLICGRPSCDCSSFPVLPHKLEFAAVKLLQQAEVNVEHPLNEFVPERLPATKKLRLPACNTTRRLNSFFVWAPRLSNSW